MKEIIENVKVTTLRFITFKDYMMGQHGINSEIRGCSLKAFYIHDYADFCKEHNVDMEPDTRVEDVKFCLTPKGLDMYNKILELRTKLKETTSESEKEILLKQLYDIRA